MNNLYNEFLETLKADLEKQALLMIHKPSSINIARRLFEGYFTEEELSERQFFGRYWDIIKDMSSANEHTLIIILDNDTVLCVSKSISNGELVEGIYTRYDAKEFLPDSLRGRYYSFIIED